MATSTEMLSELVGSLTEDRKRWINLANEPNVPHLMLILRLAMAEGIGVAISRAKAMMTTVVADGPFLIAWYDADRERVEFWTGNGWTSVSPDNLCDLSLAQQYTSRDLAKEALGRMRAEGVSEALVRARIYSFFQLANGDKIDTAMMKYVQAEY